ncbi:hypothetical protein ACFSTC_22335 [Nonomuraea ferruginea]
MSTTLYRRPGVAELHPVRTRRRWNATKVVLGVSVPVGFVVLWQLSAVLEWVDPFLYPPPSRLIPGLVALWEDGKLVEATVTSVRRVILGYLLGGPREGWWSACSWACRGCCARRSNPSPGPGTPCPSWRCCRSS